MLLFSFLHHDMHNTSATKQQQQQQQQLNVNFNKYFGNEKIII